MGKVIFWSIIAAVIGLSTHAADNPDTTSNASPLEPTSSQQQSSLQPETQSSAVTTKTVTEMSSIPFSVTTVQDSSLDKGKTEVRTNGVNGVKTATYEITYADGEQTDKMLLKEEVTTKPVNEVVAEGTYVAPAPEPKPKSNCDPNYTGTCVPNVYPEDVDCAGGSGNGPYYVQGPVYVVGIDRYHLDSDHSGVGCEKT